MSLLQVNPGESRPPPVSTISRQSSRWPILTQQPRAPWMWVIAIQLPWFTLNVIENLSNTMLTFTLREFTSVAWVITLVTSFNVFFNMVVGSTCTYQSDRIWTRWGRRRPFLIVGGLCSAVFLTLIPFVREFWMLVAVLCLYEMLRDIANPTEALEKEVVPAPQRGRAQAVTQVARVGGALFFSVVLLGCFDEQYSLPGGVVLEGKLVVYWTGALLALGTAMFYLLCVREVPPQGFDPEAHRNRVKPPISARRVVDGVVGFFRNVFGSRHNLVLLLVGVIMTTFWTDLGNLQPLLITEQFGYTKQTLGWIQGFGQVLTLVVALPLSGWLADRFDRVALFQWCAAGMLVHHIGYYLYARYLAPEGIPPVPVLLAFSTLFYSVGNVGVIAAVAMQFDFIETSRMGTLTAGLQITRTLFNLLTRNAIGIWVTVYSVRFVTSGRSDYLSGFHYLIVSSAVALVGAIWFGRLVRSGRLQPRGILEQEARLRAAGEAPGGG